MTLWRILSKWYNKHHQAGKMITDSANFMITRRIKRLCFIWWSTWFCVYLTIDAFCRQLEARVFSLWQHIEVVQTLNDEIVVKGKHLMYRSSEDCFPSPRMTRSIVLSFRNQLGTAGECILYDANLVNRSHRNCEHWLLWRIWINLRSFNIKPLIGVKQSDSIFV